MEQTPRAFQSLAKVPNFAGLTVCVSFAYFAFCGRIETTLQRATCLFRLIVRLIEGKRAYARTIYSRPRHPARRRKWSAVVYLPGSSDRREVRLTAWEKTHTPCLFLKEVRQNHV